MAAVAVAQVAVAAAPAGISESGEVVLLVGPATRADVLSAAAEVVMAAAPAGILGGGRGVGGRACHRGGCGGGFVIGRRCVAWPRSRRVGSGGGAHGAGLLRVLAPAGVEFLLDNERGAAGCRGVGFVVRVEACGQPSRGCQHRFADQVAFATRRRIRDRLADFSHVRTNVLWHNKKHGQGQRAMAGLSAAA